MQSASPNESMSISSPSNIRNLCNSVVVGFGVEGADYDLCGRCSKGEHDLNLSHYKGVYLTYYIPGNGFIRFFFAYDRSDSRRGRNKLGDGSRPLSNSEECADDRSVFVP